MKTLIFTILLTLISLSLTAFPYYSERKDGIKTYIFYGNIHEEDGPEARKLEALFMEHDRKRVFYQNELKELGIEIEVIESDAHKKTQLPLEVIKPDLPAGVTGYLPE